LLLYITDSMAAGPSRRASPVSRRQETSVIYSFAPSLAAVTFSRCLSWVNAVSICGASGNTLHWILLLVY
jgi:hypothetical protein